MWRHGANAGKTCEDGTHSADQSPGLGCSHAPCLSIWFCHRRFSIAAIGSHFFGQIAWLSGAVVPRLELTRSAKRGFPPWPRLGLAHDGCSCPAKIARDAKKDRLPPPPATLKNLKEQVIWNADQRFTVLTRRLETEVAVDHAVLEIFGKDSFESTFCRSRASTRM